MINKDVQSQLHEKIPSDQIRRHHRKRFNYTHSAGTMSTDAWLVSKPEVQLKRGLVYMGVSIVVLFMFENWHTGDEIFGPATRPYSTPVDFFSVRLTNEMFPRKFCIPTKR